MDLDNINDDMLDTLTDLVIEKLLYKFKNEVHAITPMTIGELLKGQLPFKETEEEALISELARLHTLEGMYEQNEEYIKAAIIKRKIEIIQKKLNNL